MERRALDLSAGTGPPEFFHGAEMSPSRAVVCRPVTASIGRRYAASSCTERYIWVLICMLVYRSRANTPGCLECIKCQDPKEPSPVHRLRVYTPLCLSRRRSRVLPTLSYPLPPRIPRAPLHKMSPA